MTAQRLSLRKNALTALDSLLIGVSGTAPANSLAVSTAALVGAVGLFAPGAILMGAVSMFGIAIAFYYLNAWRSDAGATYAWVGRSLSPSLGFLAGWSVLIANTIFMVAGSLPAAAATLDLLAPRVASNIVAVALVGAAWFVLINIVVLVGIRTTAYFQKIVTAVEIGGIALLAAAGIVHALRVHPAAALTLGWFSPLGPGGLKAFMAGALVALFYYWGWDSTANVAEETVDHARTPGLGGLFSMLVLVALFVLAQVSFQMNLSAAGIIQANSDVFTVFANTLMPKPWSDVAIIVIVVSTIGTLEASLLVVSRTLLSMSRDRVISSRFGELHPRFLTPWYGSMVMGSLSLVLFALAAASSSVNSLLTETINAIGIYIAVYYGLAAFACAWYYRRTLTRSARTFWLRGAWPVAAGLFLWIVVVMQLLSAGWRADAITLGLLFSGLVPLWICRRRYRSAFYTDPLELASATR